jgi:hypothetical protein
VAKDPAYRSWLTSGALLVRLVGRLLDFERPDLVLVSSGRTLLSAIVTSVARQRRTTVVTWDTEPSFPDGLVFSSGKPAVEIPLDHKWPEAARIPLTAEQRAELHGFLGSWAKSEGTPFPYNPTPTSDHQTIRNALALRPNARLIVAYANSAWDMAVVDRDVAFGSMFEWLFTLVDYAKSHPEIDLVVRAHPAEVKVPPDLQSRTPVVSEIRKRYERLPGNVKLVDGHSTISSYTLADLADVPMFYASRIGLEIALRGKRPWLAGDVTYRRKGFTRDLTSKTEMLELLESRDIGESLSDDQVALAERFAYLWFFRFVTRLSSVRPPEGRFALRTLTQLAPGRDPALDRVCAALVGGDHFLDLSRALQS